MGKILKICGIFMVFAGAVCLTNLANAQTANAACIDNVYKYSLKSKTCVKYIQIIVNNLLYKEGLSGISPLAVDGKFGNKTRDAIIRIQSYTAVENRGENHWTYLTKDGIVGRQTWAILCLFQATDYSVKVKAGCFKSNGDFRAFDYYSGAVWFNYPH